MEQLLYLIRLNVVLNNQLERLVQAEQEHTQQGLGVYHTGLAMNPYVKRELGNNLVNLLNVFGILYANCLGHSEKPPENFTFFACSYG